MDIILILTIILAIILIFAVISIMKKLLKVALILGLIFIVLFLVTGGSIMNDFSNLKDSIINDPSIVLLESNNNIITGFIDSKEIDFLDDAEIALLNGLYNDNNLEEIKTDNYKLFIIKINLLEDIEINRKQVTREEITEFLKNDKQISSITYEDIIMDMDIVDNQRNSKSALFANVYNNKIKMTKAPISFFNNYKAGNITVYPETLFFRFTKFIPLEWIGGKLNKLKELIKEKADEAITGAVTFVEEKVKKR